MRINKTLDDGVTSFNKLSRLIISVVNYDISQTFTKQNVAAEF